MFYAELSVIRIAELEGESWRMLTGQPVLAPADERHGNKILKLGQHLFTFKEKSEIPEKKVRKGSGMWG